MKKIISAVLAAVLFITGTAAAFAAESDGRQLQFNKDGKFKIMLLADPQDGYPIREDFIYLLNEALDKAEPDLVVFLGDNVMGADEWSLEKYKMGFDQMLAPIVEREIPFTLVFGNHDEESSPGLTKEQILEIYQSFDGCLAYDAVPELHGCATHNLPILSSDGTHTAFNLWMMDSGSYAYTEKTGYHYDCVRRDQIEWYEQTSKALEKENGAPVPSFMFQHIVPADVAEQVMVTLPFHLKNITDYNIEDGKSLSFLPNIFGFKSGLVGEIPCPSTENEGQMDSISQRGDVLALFFGHDHVNDFVGVDDNGIRMGYVGGFGYLIDAERARQVGADVDQRLPEGRRLDGERIRRETPSDEQPPGNRHDKNSPRPERPERAQQVHLPR